MSPAAWPKLVVTGKLRCGPVTLKAKTSANELISQADDVPESTQAKHAKAVDDEKTDKEQVADYMRHNNH